eukprot:TRINITY_DN50739_c0_g1_i1.p1 TRINITY_DN50739_c0_g1~~TRINITY_DN50739_c0_g1_i1.p1  ORF type:complete len:468 (+),score=48.16 TRINITY_DN50739_c0_g1_i1:183-1586(+)
MGWRGIGGVVGCSLGLLKLFELLIVAAQEKQTTTHTGPDYTYYHKYEDLLKEVDHVVEDNPDLMRVETLKGSDVADNKEYSAEIKVVTVELGGITDDHSGKMRILLNYGQHGREIITCEAALYLLDMLMDLDRMRDSVKHRPNGEQIEALLDNTVFKVIPMENVQGRRKVENGEWCLRKNGRGVDTNRNWDINFGKKEKDYDPYEEYPGKHPFSEPESQIIMQVVQDFEPHVWINVHSGTYALFMPYDHMASIPNVTGSAEQLTMLKQLNEIVCEKKCAVGSGGQAVGYLAHGTATDYVYEKMKVPLSFTWEIYGDEKASYNECFKMFNPINKETYDNVLEMWSIMVLELLLLLPKHPRIPTINLSPKSHKLDHLPSQLIQPAHATNDNSNQINQEVPSVQLSLNFGRKEAIGFDSSRSREQDQQMVQGFTDDWFVVFVIILLVAVSVYAFRRQRFYKQHQKIERKI